MIKTMINFKLNRSTGKGNELVYFTPSFPSFIVIRCNSFITDTPSNYMLVISDFYYLESADILKNELAKKTKFNSFSVKKIKNNKYRLLAGPFKNFNSLKTTYISLNNLGFDDLNIYNN